MKVADLLRALSEADVRFVLMGGLAVQLHGFLRSTFDVDVTLAMDDGNLSRFIGVARAFDLRPVVPVAIDSLRNAAQIEQWRREKGMLAFALREPEAGGTVVDVTVRPEVAFVDLEARATKVAFFGREVRIAAIDDLLTMKRVANRPKDLLDFAAPKRSNKVSIRMADPACSRSALSEARWLQCLERFEQTRDFFIQAWLQNPALARQAGECVQAMLAPAAAPDREPVSSRP